MAEAKRVISWPLSIAIIYGLFVVAMLAYLIFSRFNTVELVTPDYYSQDLKYQQQIDRANRTRDLTNDITWKYDQQKGNISLQFPADIEPQAINGKIVFFRPSDASLDNTVGINPNASGRQIINTSRLQSGMWRLKIFWKVDDTDYYSEGTIEIKE
jgi:hypothetical protein